MLDELPGYDRRYVKGKRVDGSECVYLFDFYYVYSLINKRNGKRYIGRTINPKNRIQTHLSSLRSGKHYNKLMQLDAGDGFLYEILESGISYKDISSKEREYMVKFKTYDSNFGYNFNDNYFK